MPTTRLHPATLIGLAVVAATTWLPAVPARADHAPPAADVVVDTLADSFDGTCADDDCSLRDAVADAAPGETIGVPAGVITLTRTGAGPDSGDLDLTTDVVVVGTGATGTFIDASGLGDRVVQVAGAEVSLERLTLLGGETGGRGGALAVGPGASLTLDHVTVVGSRARNGGGVAATDAVLRVRASSLVDTRADARGGGISAHGASDVVIERSTVTGATALLGGGIWTSPGSSLRVERSTLARNGAGSGGAIRTSAAPASVIHTTIARNRATTAAAIAAGSPVTLEGDVVAANRSDRGRPCLGPVRGSGHNVGTWGTASCGLGRPSDRIVADAGIGPFSTHGGPTPTISLRPGSPAIDRSGDCAATDQRGVRRDRRCDAGSYELARCADAIVNVVGTRHDDELSGGRKNDGIVGNAGDDELQGSIGADGICGGGGNDRLLGGPGADRLAGGAGNDRVDGERGDDRLRGGPGRDLLIGGAGRDVCVLGPGDRAHGCERERARS